MIYEPPEWEVFLLLKNMLSIERNLNQRNKEFTQTNLSSFQEGFYFALGLTDEQLLSEQRTFEDKVCSIFISADFSENDLYSSNHFLAEMVVKNWPKKNLSFTQPQHQDHPEEDYVEIANKLITTIENENNDIMPSIKNEIEAKIIQGLIQTEISLREYSTSTLDTPLFGLSNGKRNKMLFHLSDNLQESIVPIEVINEENENVMESGKDYNLSSAA